MSISSYMNRALRSKDPRFALILKKISERRAAPTIHIPNPPLERLRVRQAAATNSTGAETQELREQYKSLFGVNAPKSWSARKLRAKIAEKVG